MTTEATNSPAFMLYRVDGNGSEARWTRIGAAWPNKDGKGFNILCDAVPLQGRTSCGPTARSRRPKTAPTPKRARLQHPPGGPVGAERPRPTGPHW